jgi:hypothetical protein
MRYGFRRGGRLPWSDRDAHVKVMGESEYRRLVDHVSCLFPFVSAKQSTSCPNLGPLVALINLGYIKPTAHLVEFDT